MHDIDRALLRNAEDWVRAIKDALRSRKWHPSDPMPEQLRRELREKQRYLDELRDHLKKKYSPNIYGA